MGRALASAVLCCCAAAARPGAAVAQTAPNLPPAPAHVELTQAQQYLQVTDAVDARALWVNPAGLSRSSEASIGLDFTAADSLSGVRVRQYGALIASHAIAAGWEHDDLPGGTSGNTFAVGAGLGSERLGVGGTRRWYRGPGANAGTWEIGAHLHTVPALDLAAIWRNIGSPTVRDSILEETLIAGAALDIVGRVRASADWQLATSGFVTRRVRVGLSLLAGRGVLVSALSDLSSNSANRAFTVVIQLNGAKGRVTAFARDPGPPEAASSYGVSLLSVSEPPAGHAPRH